MRELRKEDRAWIEEAFRRRHWDSFYHYFPLMYAISESTEKILVDSDVIRAGKDLYVPPLSGEVPEDAERIWIALERPSSDGWSYELYDVNFIYSVDTTLKIKNLRDNVRRFEREHDQIDYVEAKPDEAVEVVSRWYQKSPRKSFTDFGYTIWLAENFREFPDLRARVVEVQGRPVAFSLWGELDQERGLAIHLICKDVGWPYLQDYTRYRTYQEMAAWGFKYVNDGGDAGLEGLRIYKLKLRPFLIIPIWSWVRRNA